MNERSTSFKYIPRVRKKEEAFFVRVERDKVKRQHPRPPGSSGRVQQCYRGEPFCFVPSIAVVHYLYTDNTLFFIPIRNVVGKTYQ